MKKHKFAILTFFLLVFLFSCRTVPDVPQEEPREYIPLEAGALVYIFADVTTARPLLELFLFPELENRQVRQMLERTHTAAAALFPQESGRHFQLVSWGNYPTFRAGMGFSFNRQWRRRRSDAGDTFWHSRENMLSLVVRAREAFVTAWTTDTPEYPVTPAPGIQYPEGFVEFKEGAVISFWLEDPQPRLNNIFQAVGLPLQLPAERAFVSLFSTEIENQYEAMLQVRVPTVTQARAFIAILSLARAFMGPSAGIAVESSGPRGIMDIITAVLFANPPVLNDRDLNIRTAALNEDDIALLFSLFLVQ